MNEGSNQPTIDEAITEVRSEWRKALGSLRTFWRTKRAVETGVPLYDWPITEIHKAGYLGPVKFTIIATAITGIVVSVITNFINLLAGSEADTLDVSSEIIPTAMYIANTVVTWLRPFIVPILFIYFSYFIAWGSLQSKDSNPQARGHARSAYVYFNCTYGFTPQLIISLGFGFFSTKLSQKLLASTTINPLITAFILLLVIVFFRQLWITERKIPRLLFTQHGYTTRVRHFWQRSLPNDPPWNRLFYATSLWLMSMFVLILLWDGICIALAWFLVSLRTLLV